MLDMTVFQNAQFGEVRTVTLSGEPWFVAADVCRALAIGNPTDSINRLDEDERTLVSIEGASNGLPVNAVNESGLYALVLGSRKPEARAFKRWITHDVLPALRKHGVYAADKLLDDPDALIAALQAYKEERELRRRAEAKNAAQDQLVSEMRPKVSYYDLVLASANAVPITLIAKDYGMSGKHLNGLLHDLGVQYKLDGTWLLYQKYAEQGYTKSMTHPVAEDRSVLHTYWTQKGRLFLYDLLKNERGLLPIMERTIAG